jgi:hypothetical protein
MAIFQAPLTRLVVHRTHEYSKSVRSINDLLFRRGRAGENGERSSLRYPTAFAVGTVIIKATVAALLAQKYIFNGPSTPLVVVP